MCSGFQPAQSASVTRPDNLQHTFGDAASRPQIARPGIDRAGADVRLRQMIQYERLAVELRHEIGRDREMPRVDQDVVRQAEVAESRDPAAEVGAKQEAIVGLGLHDVTNADELRMRRHPLELPRGTSSARRSTQPTTPAMNGCASASWSSQWVSSSV